MSQEIVCRAGLAKCWLTPELRNGRLEVHGLRIYASDAPIAPDDSDGPLGMMATIWIEEHRGCEHDTD